MTTEQLTAELQATQAANEALLDGCAGLGIAYLANRVKELERLTDSQGARIGTLEAKNCAAREYLSDLVKRLQAVEKQMRARTDDQPTPAKGATK